MNGNPIPKDSMKSNPANFAHLSATQWAFLSGCSTVTALLSVTQDLFTTLESGKEICVIFFDYQNAFDSIPHAAKLTDIQFSLQWLLIISLTESSLLLLMHGAESCTFWCPSRVYTWTSSLPPN